MEKKAGAQKIEDPVKAIEGILSHVKKTSVELQHEASKIRAERYYLKTKKRVRTTMSSPKPSQQTESRKKDHVELVLRRNVQYQKTTGLEQWDFVHCALPEVDFDKINLGMRFLGKKLAFPLLITGMTGGYADAERINRALAQTAEKFGVAFGVGSQRAMIENARLRSTYYVRDVAPHIPILGNIGGVQLRKYGIAAVEQLVQGIEADALAIHLNPLQEMIQPEGDRDFTGILDMIARACDELPVPVIVKETGAGISREVAVALRRVGVAYVDVSGAGGTSWSRVEYERKGLTPGFEEWGIPTADALIQCKGIVPLIASGGIRNGIDVCKSVALGAELGGAAYPFIKAVQEGNLPFVLHQWHLQMKTAALLTGSKDYAALKQAKMVRK